MRTKIILQIALPCFIALFSFSFAFGQSWLWCAGGYGSYVGNSSHIATDKNGNSYLAGAIDGPTYFGHDSLHTIIDNSFLVKYDSSGNVIWATQPVCTTGSQTTAIATDSSGDIYIAGYFVDSIKFGSFNLKGSSLCIYLVKYNSSGSVLWCDVVYNACTSYNINPVLAVDPAGDAYLAGDPDTSFINKYSSNGIFLWKRKYIGHGVGGLQIAADPVGNVFATGWSDSLIILGTDTLHNYLDINYFVMKVNSFGTVLWAERAGGKAKVSNISSDAIVTDNSGQVYIAGQFWDSATFGHCSLYADPGFLYFFLTKYDSNGNAIWAQSASKQIKGTGLTADNNNHIYLTGVAGDTIKFGSFINYFDAYYHSSFLVKFDSDGTAVCGSELQESVNPGTYFPCAASDQSGKYVFIGGNVNRDTIICGTDTIPLHVSPEIPFVARWQPCSNNTEGINNFILFNNSISVFPNPSTGKFTMQLSVVSCQWSVEVYNVLGGCVYSKSNIENSISNIDLSSQPSGIYLYRVVSEDGKLVGNGKLVIEK